VTPPSAAENASTKISVTANPSLALDKTSSLHALEGSAEFDNRGSLALKTAPLPFLSHAEIPLSKSNITNFTYRSIIEVAFPVLFKTIFCSSYTFADRKLTKHAHALQVVTSSPLKRTKSLDIALFADGDEGIHTAGRCT
jgi:hypothetical protein